MSETEEDSDHASPKSQEVLRGIRLPSGQGHSRVSGSERDYLIRFRNLSIDAQVQYAHLQGIKDHYWHKGKWSWFLMAAVGGMIIFQSVLLWKVGKGELDFTQYEWLLPALLVQNLGQVIGLAAYAVKYLFSDIRGNSD
ncbi:hypothetical protein [Roseibium sp. MB-4]